jgi:nicotinamidase-related amidase
MAGTPALLIVHMQNSVIKTPSPLEVLGHGKAAHEQGVIDNIERLVAAFRKKGRPVVYSVTYTSPGVKWPVYGGFWQGSQQIKVNHMGTWDVGGDGRLGAGRALLQPHHPRRCDHGCQQ